MARWDKKRRLWRITASAYRPGAPRHRVVRSVKTPNNRAGRRAAEEAEIKLRAEVIVELEARRGPGGMSPGSFAQAAHAWMDRHPRWSPKTVKETRYALLTYILPALGPTPLDEVSPAQIEDLYAAWVTTGYADSTQRRWHGMIHSIFADAIRLGLLTTNPMIRVTPAGGSAPERMHIPSPAEVRKAIASAASPTGSTFFELAAATGARRGTIVALRWRDVDLEVGTVTFAHAVAVGDHGPVLKGTKANRPYAVHLPPAALAALRDHRRRAGETALALGLGGDLRGRFVFSNDGGQTHWSVEYPSHAWRVACGRAGIAPCRLHDLRHFTATQLLANRVPYRVVAERLGCTEANVIKTYSHWVPTSEDARAAEVIGAVLAL
jgi:integrase